MSIKGNTVLTRGGDALGMNAVMRSVVLAAHHYKLETIVFFLARMV